MRARHRGKKTYYFYDTGGKPRKEIPLGSDYVLAVRKWAELDIKPVPTELITFRAACNRYMKEVIPTKKTRTQSDNLIEIENLLKFFDDPAGFPLDEIIPLHVRQFLTWRVNEAKEKAIKAGKVPPEDLGQVRANREKALFSHIWNMARDWGYTEKPNPCAGIKGYREDGRDVYIEKEVFAALYEAANQPVRDAMDLAYLTGQRPADTLKMQITDIRDGMITVKQGKRGMKLRVRVIGELAAVIARIERAKKAHEVSAFALVCDEEGRPLSASALDGRWDHARRRAIIAHPELEKAIMEFQFRDLRAKAGTDKTEATGDIRQAQMQLGHTKISTTEIYVRKRKGHAVDPTK